MTTYLDTNVVIRHFVGQPADQARRATAYLAGGAPVMLTDVVVTECVYVLQSYYELAPDGVALRLRSLLGLSNVRLEHEDRILRALQLYELLRLPFADAYLAACAELDHPSEVVSFDRDFDRVPSVHRVEPS